MNERQRIYFRQKLLAWKEEIIRQTRETLVSAHDSTSTPTSPTVRPPRPTARWKRGRATASASSSPRSTRHWPASSTHVRLLRGNGRADGLKRLDARPIATLSLEAQERHERRERVYREE